MRFKNLAAMLSVALVCSIGSSAVTYNLVMSKETQPVVQAQEATNVKKAVNVINPKDTKNQNVYQAVAEKASPSVVGIVSETVTTDNFFNQRQVVRGSGTGFIVDKRGYILTNAHVVSDGAVKDVNVIFENSESTRGKVVWADPNLDLAIVKVDKKGLVPAELGNSDDVKVGDIVIAIGNPLGTDLMTSVTQGIISGLNRDVNTANSSMSGLMQTDASINPGNSGGPLLNQEGQVIGINTAKANADNLGFSIPINTAKIIVQKVIEDNNYTKPMLGIMGMDVKTVSSYTGKDFGTENGIWVKDVQKDSLADRCGIKPGDIIVSMDGTKIKNMGDISKKMYAFDKDCKMIVIRDGKKKTIDLKISKLKQVHSLKNLLS